MTDLSAAVCWLNVYGLCVWFAVIGLFLHEGGHVVGCLITGRKLLSVQIGTGPLLFGLRVGGVPVTVRWLPVSGLVQYSLTHPKGTVSGRKAKCMLLASACITAAGPFGNVLAIVLIGYAAQNGLRHDVAQLSVINQFFTLIWNLYPHNVVVDRDGQSVAVPKNGKRLLGYARSWSLITRHPDRMFTLAGVSDTPPVDRLTGTRARHRAKRHPTPWRGAILIGLSGLLLAGALLQNGRADGVANIGSWWPAGRTNPFPPLSTSSLEDWVRAAQPRNLIVINANCPGAGIATVVRLHEAASGALAATGYLHQGDQVRFTLPDGRYILSIATGRDWIDASHLFGAAGVYTKAIEPLVVYRDFDRRVIHNETVWLCQPSGNLPTAPTNAQDF